MPVPVLRTERLILTLPSVHDATALLQYATDNEEHLKPWSPKPPPDAFTRAATLERIDRIRRDFDSGRSVRFWAKLSTDPTGPFVAAVSLSEIVRDAFRSCFLGYHLHKDHLGQGLMTEAVRRAIDYAFAELFLHRISANYMPNNERSAALLKRLGFVVEGYARDYLFINGRYRDHLLTSLLNPQPVDPEQLELAGR